MTIEKTQESGKIILTVEGKISTTTAQQFGEALIPAFDEAKEVIVDCSGLVYIASAGLRVLFTGHETAGLKNAKMTLRGVSDEVMEIFDMTGFSAFLEIES